MLVTTNMGKIYTITSGGSVSLLASVGEDTEGMDIATSAWGPFAGDLMVSSEGSGHLRLISPTGVVTDMTNTFGISVPEAETVSFVPLNLNAADPLQGFYVANYPFDIQFAPASDFTTQGLQGDAIVTEEFAGGSGIVDIHYDQGSGTFSESLFAQTGNQLNQSEDGIFVTGQREVDVTAPEPASLVFLTSGGAAGLGTWLVRRRRKA